MGSTDRFCFGSELFLDSNASNVPKQRFVCFPIHMTRDCLFSFFIGDFVANLHLELNTLFHFPLS
jgi:hypothetical protein